MTGDRVTGTAQWWEILPEPNYPDGDLGARETIELTVTYDGEVFYVDGLRDGRYLEIPAELLLDAMTRALVR